MDLSLIMFLSDHLPSQNPVPRLLRAALFLSKTVTKNPQQELLIGARESPNSALQSEYTHLSGRGRIKRNKKIFLEHTFLKEVLWERFVITGLYFPISVANRLVV